MDRDEPAAAGTEPLTLDAALGLGVPASWKAAERELFRTLSQPVQTRIATRERMLGVF